MDAQEIKDRIKWFHEEVYNKRNIAVLDEFMAPNYSGLDMLTGQKGGLQDFKQSIGQIMAMYPVAHLTIEDIVVEGNRAAFRSVTTIKDPQGKALKWAIISMWTFVDGKVAEDYYIGGEIKS